MVGERGGVNDGRESSKMYNNQYVHVCGDIRMAKDRAKYSPPPPPPPSPRNI